MPRYEDKTAEEIWQVIDALKRTPDAASSNGAPHAPSSDTELDDLIPLAETLSTIFREESRASSGQTTARLRLLEAIQSDLISRPIPAKPVPATSRRFVWPRNLALMALLILLAVAAMAIAFWATSQNPACGLPVNSAPVAPAPPCQSSAPYTLPGAPTPNKAPKDNATKPQSPAVGAARELRLYSPCHKSPAV